MTSHNGINQLFRFSNAVVTISLATAAIVGLMVATLLGLGWGSQLAPCLVACALCAAASMVAMAPVAWLSRSQGAQGVAMGFLGGMVVRLLVCGVGALVLRPRMGASVSLWIAAWYMVELVLEVGLVGRYLKGLPCPAAHAAPAPLNPMNP